MNKIDILTPIIIFIQQNNSPDPVASPSTKRQQEILDRLAELRAVTCSIFPSILLIILKKLGHL